MKVVKYGGSSLADAVRFHTVAEIIKKDPERRVIVVSAPGSRYNGDKKITDLLLDWCANQDNPKSLDFSRKIHDRFSSIVDELGLSKKIDLVNEFATIEKHIHEHPFDEAYIVSRGEYLSAKIMALLLGFKFMDAIDCIRFDSMSVKYAERYQVDSQKIETVLQENKGVVVPGFYASKFTEKKVVTFPRGGSDITGALLASSLKSKVKLYENWSDVDGFCVASPKMVQNPQVIGFIDLSEAMELAMSGAQILHWECLALTGGVPIHLLNTFNPSAVGTLITKNSKLRGELGITGIANRDDLSHITVSFEGLNARVGILAEITTIFSNNGVSIEHINTSCESVSILATNENLEPKKKQIRSELEGLDPNVSIETARIALISVVGKTMYHNLGIAASILTTLAQAKVNIRFLSQTPKENTIVIGTAVGDQKSAVKALYNHFFV